MLTILEGQISFAGGLHDALDVITTHKNVQRGVLRITSDSGSGLIGVFCGRYITGAMMTLTGQTKIRALKQLLSASNGTYAFMDAMGEHIGGLNQSLAIDIHLLLEQHNFSDADLPLSEESLAGMGASEEEIDLIDTSAVDDEDVDEFTEAKRIEHINQTYDRLLAVSEYERLTQAGVPISGERVEGSIDVSQYTGTATAQKSPYTDELDELRDRKKIEITPKMDRGKFQKLEHWSTHGELYTAAWLWGSFVVISVLVWIFYNKQIIEGFKVLNVYLK